MTHGMSYKFSLLNQSIIRSLWEIGDKFSLKNPNHVRHMALERRLIGIKQDLRSHIWDLKSQRYICFNIELLEGKKKLDHVLSRIAKDMSLLARKPKKGVEKRCRRAEIHVSTFYIFIFIS